MIIGALQKFSLLDYPGCLSAIVFTQGCNFRCPFCYNPMLVALTGDRLEKDHPYEPVTEDDFFVFLESRVGKLDAVVITGGEPTLHNDLIGFAARIKVFGYKIKLDTNGSNPEMIAKLIAGRLVDYIAMDIKGAPDKYAAITRTSPDFNKIRESVIMIKEGNTPHEFRTTVVPGLIGREDIERAGALIAEADKWYLQRFKSDTDLLDENLRSRESYDDRTMEDLRTIGSRYARNCALR